MLLSLFKKHLKQETFEALIMKLTWKIAGWVYKEWVTLTFNMLKATSITKTYEPTLLNVDIL